MSKRQGSGTTLAFDIQHDRKSNSSRPAKPSTPYMMLSVYCDCPGLSIAATLRLVIGMLTGFQGFARLICTFLRSPL